MKRENISSGASWEDIAGYSRAVKKGNMIFVSGTTSVDENSRIIAPGDAYGQTRFIFSKIEKALKQAGSSMSDVVRTRMFVTDISFSDEILKAHHEFFAEIKPAATLVEVKGLIDDNLLVEIEIDAITGEYE